MGMFDWIRRQKTTRHAAETPHDGTSERTPVEGALPPRQDIERPLGTDALAKASLPTHDASTTETSPNTSVAPAAPSIPLPEVLNEKEILSAEFEKYRWLNDRAEYRLLVLATSPLPLPIDSYESIPQYKQQGTGFGQIEYQADIPSTDVQVIHRWHTPSNLPYVNRGPVHVIEREIAGEKYRLVDLSDLKNRKIFDEVQKAVGRKALKAVSSRELPHGHLWVLSAYVLDASPLREVKALKVTNEDGISLEEQFRKVIKDKSHWAGRPDKKVFDDLIESVFEREWSDDRATRLEDATRRISELAAQRISWGSMRTVLGSMPRRWDVMQVSEVVEECVKPLLDTDEEILKQLGDGRRLMNYLRLMYEVNPSWLLERGLKLLGSIDQKGPLDTIVDLLSRSHRSELVDRSYYILKDSKHRYSSAVLLRAAETLRMFEKDTERGREAERVVHRMYDATLDIALKSKIEKGKWGTTEPRFNRRWLLGSVAVAALGGGGIGVYRFLNPAEVPVEQDIDEAAKFFRSLTKKLTPKLETLLVKLERKPDSPGGLTAEVLPYYANLLTQIGVELEAARNVVVSENRVGDSSDLYVLRKPLVGGTYIPAAGLSNEILNQLDEVNGASLSDYVLLARELGAAGIVDPIPQSFLPGVFATVYGVDKLFSYRNFEKALADEISKTTLRTQLEGLRAQLEAAEKLATAIALTTEPAATPGSAGTIKYQTVHIAKAMKDYAESLDALKSALLAPEMATPALPLQKSVELEGPSEKRALPLEDRALLEYLCTPEVRLAESLGLGKIQIQASYDWSALDGAQEAPPTDPFKTRGVLRISTRFQAQSGEGVPTTEPVRVFSAALFGSTHTPVDAGVGSDVRLCVNELKGFSQWTRSKLKEFRSTAENSPDPFVRTQSEQILFESIDQVVQKEIRRVQGSSALASLPTPHRWREILQGIVVPVDAIDPKVKSDISRMVEHLGRELDTAHQSYDREAKRVAELWARAEEPLRTKYISNESGLNRRLKDDERPVGFAFRLGEDPVVRGAWIKAHALLKYLREGPVVKEVAENGAERKELDGAQSSVNALLGAFDRLLARRKLLALMIHNRFLGEGDIHLTTGKMLSFSPEIRSRGGITRLYGVSRDHQKFQKRIIAGTEAATTDALRIPELIANLESELADSQKALKELGALDPSMRRSPFGEILGKVQQLIAQL